GGVVRVGVDEAAEEVAAAEDDGQPGALRLEEELAAGRAGESRGARAGGQVDGVRREGDVAAAGLGGTGSGARAGRDGRGEPGGGPRERNGPAGRRLHRAAAGQLDAAAGDAGAGARERDRSENG